jgi:UDP-N-acetylmuramate dehydrogenase
MSLEHTILEFAGMLNRDQVLEQVPMRLYTSFRTGGPASVMLLPKTVEEIEFVLEVCQDNNMPYYIMGNGTNLLVGDKGYKGAIINLSDRFNKVRVNGNIITAQAGALLSTVSKTAAKHGLSGMEFACGIPGTIGGGVVMNAGAYDRDLSDIILTAVYLDKDGTIQEDSKNELKLSYRHSVFQENGATVLSAQLYGWPDDPEIIKATMQELMTRRNEKQPIQWPSAGSTFKRPPGHFAAKLIEDAGLKGLILGGARVSPMHAGFIINEKNATSQDIIDLIAVVKQTVLDHSGILLEEEVKIIE